MHLKIPHKFRQAEAVMRIKTALDKGRSQLPKEVEIHETKWEENTMHFDFSAQGQRITGVLLVEEHSFVVYAKLPLMLRLFEGRLQREIESKMKELT